jgi:hypothetical protein
MPQQLGSPRLGRKNIRSLSLLLLAFLSLAIFPLPCNAQKLDARREAARRAAAVIDSWVRSLEYPVQKLRINSFKGDRKEEFCVALVEALREAKYPLDFDGELEREVKKIIVETRSHKYNQRLEPDFTPPDVLITGEVLDYDAGRVKLKMAHIRKNAQHSAIVRGTSPARGLATNLFITLIIGFVIMAGCRFLSVTIGFFQTFIYALGLIITLIIAWFLVLKDLDLESWL